VRGVGVSGLPDGAVMLDAEGRVLAPTRFGVDAQGEQAKHELFALVGERNLRNLTARQTNPTALAVRYLDQSSAGSRAGHDLAALLQPADFIRYRFTGEAATDHSMASHSMLFSPRNRQWSRQLLQHLDLTPDLLPSAHPGGQLVGRVGDAAAKESGLQAGTPVVAGAAPLAATAVALGAERPGDLVLVMDARGGAYCVDAALHRDRQGRLDAGCHPCDDRYCLETDGVCATAGLDWLTQTVMPNEVQAARRHKRSPLDHLAEIAAECQPGADGLVFLGTAGNRASGFVGLRGDHRRRHLVRSVLEAGALATGRLVRDLEHLRCPPERVMLCGPGATNALWCQMVADAVDRPVSARPVPSPAATGVALLAAVATGGFKSLVTARKKIAKPAGSYQPRRAAAACYRQLGPERDSIISTLDIGDPDGSDRD